MAVKDHLGSGFRGGVVKQTNPDRPRGALTERRCSSCRQWYLVKGNGYTCPHCEAVAVGSSPRDLKASRKRILDAHLREQAIAAERNK